MPSETLIECPFCRKLTVKIINQPFVTRKSMSKSRFGTGGPKFTKERHEVLSGCSNCGATKAQIKEKLEGKEKITHEERVKRLKKRGLSLVIESKYGIES